MKNLQHTITLVGGIAVLLLCFESLNRYLRKKWIYQLNIIHKHHSHMMDNISNRHSEHRFVFCTFGAVAYKLKVASLFADWRSTKLASLILLNFSVFFKRRIWAKMTCNCGCNCPDRNVKHIGATITCHALAGYIAALKPFLNNVLSTPYHMVPLSVLLVLSVSRNPRKTYKHIGIHAYIPACIQTWPESLFLSIVWLRLRAFDAQAPSE